MELATNIHVGENHLQARFMTLFLIRFISTSKYKKLSWSFVCFHDNFIGSREARHFHFFLFLG